jgi:hypothetical protein
MSLLAKNLALRKQSTRSFGNFLSSGCFILLVLSLVESALLTKSRMTFLFLKYHNVTHQLQMSYLPWKSISFTLHSFKLIFLSELSQSLPLYLRNVYCLCDLERQTSVHELRNKYCHSEYTRLWPLPSTVTLVMYVRASLCFNSRITVRKRIKFGRSFVPW